MKKSKMISSRLLGVSESNVWLASRDLRRGNGIGRCCTWISIKFGLCDQAGYLPHPSMAQVLYRGLHGEQRKGYGLWCPAPLICCDREEWMAKSRGQICPSMWSAVPVPEKAACPRADPTPSPENNRQFSSSSCGSAGTAWKKQGTLSSPGPAQARWLQHMSSVRILALLVTQNELQEELCFIPLRSAVLRQGQANLTAHCYLVSAPLCSQQCPWTGNKFSATLLAINLPYHYMNTGARIGVQQKLMARAKGRDVTIPFVPSKQFKWAVTQSSTLSSFPQQHPSHPRLPLLFTALNPSAPAVTTFVSFLEESIRLASHTPGSSPKLIQVLALTITASHLKILHPSPQGLPALRFEQQAS